MRRGDSGFTLIELMVVVAIAAILAMIAYPSYLRYVARGNRAAAQGYLMNVAQRQQQYLQDFRSYAGTTTMNTILGAPPANVAAQYTVAINTDPAAQISGCSATPPYFYAQATPIAGSAQSAAGESALTICQDGTKLPATVWQ